MVLPGTKVVVYVDPDNMTSWRQQGIDAWYHRLELNYYRNLCLYCPATKGYCTSALYDLFPQHCMLPEFTPTEHAIELYDELRDSIKRFKSKPRQKLLQKLAAALQNIARQNEPTNQEGAAAALQRVKGRFRGWSHQRWPQPTIQRHPHLYTRHHEHTSKWRDGILPAGYLT